MKKYTVTGMSCAACQARVEKAVGKLPGVSSCSVSLLTNSLLVEGEVPDREVQEAVEKAGYGFISEESITSSPHSRNGEKGDTEKQNTARNKKEATSFLDRETAELKKRFLQSLLFLALLYLLFYSIPVFLHLRKCCLPSL